MPSHGLRTSVTLYQSGTLSLEQAARHAGLSEATFVDRLATYGVDVDDDAVPETADRVTAD